MAGLSQFKSSVARNWSKVVWDGLIDAMEARLAPLEENLGVQRATVDAIIARGLSVIEMQLAPVVVAAEDRLSIIEQMRVDAAAAYGVIQALADQDIGAVIQPLLVQSQEMLADANAALADALNTIATIQSTAEKNQPGGYAGLDGAGKLPWNKLADVPESTTAAAGIVKLATPADVQAGTDTSTAVTPAGLAARTATTWRPGLVELATDAEVEAGTDIDRPVTSAPMMKLLNKQRVRFDAAQALTDAEKATARSNVGAVGVTQLPNNVDLNTVVNAGFYRIENAPGNAPASVQYSQLIVSRQGDTIAQLVIRYTDATMFVRSGYDIGTGSPTFTAWNEIVSPSSIGKAVMTAANAAAVRTVIGAQATLSYTPADKAGDNFSGKVLISGPAANIGSSSGNIGGLTVAQDGDALISFNSIGAFGAHFGLRPDGDLYIGGWSYGSGVARKIWTTRHHGQPIESARLAYAGDTGFVQNQITEPYSGGIVTGYRANINGIDMLRYRYLQVLRGGSWLTVGNA